MIKKEFLRLVTLIPTYSKKNWRQKLSPEHEKKIKRLRAFLKKQAKANVRICDCGKK